MTFKTLARLAGVGLCALAFCGVASAHEGGEEGSTSKKSPPGQAKKAEKAQQAANSESQSQEGKAAKSENKPEKGKQESGQQQNNTSGSYKATSSGSAGHRHTICHATGSSSNPYVVITPSVSGVFNGHMGGGHQGGEDIIPPFTYKGVQYSQNWNAQGQAMFANGCRPAQQQQPQQQADVCPNIEKHQDKVPPGHAKDEKGNCVQPQQQPQAQQQPTDVCPNIEGMQTSVPSGMVKDSQGNCVAPTVVAAAAPAPPAGKVKGAVSPAPVAKKAKAPAQAQPAGGVLGEVAPAPEAIEETGEAGTLPFTGVSLWFVALLGAGLLATGLVLRRSLNH